MFFEERVFVTFEALSFALMFSIIGAAVGVCSGFMMRKRGSSQVEKKQKDQRDSMLASAERVVDPSTSRPADRIGYNCRSITSTASGLRDGKPRFSLDKSERPSVHFGISEDSPYMHVVKGSTSGLGVLETSKASTSVRGILVMVRVHMKYKKM
jgi:hypothetical protein